jgi:hypothetical protein
MAQIDEVKAACARLAGMGWQSLLKQHGLDIVKADLAAELARELTIDRSVPGFEDFTLAGKRGIEPGLPAASLLYHAFASPDVHPTATGEPATSVDVYPTLAELDAVENYIYGLRPFNPASLKDVVIGVFAYEYRPGASTAHGYHADFVFSRTGIARVGTRGEAWDGARRGFRGDPAGQSGIAVTPARYAAFLAEARRPLAADPIMGRRDERNDPHRTFLFPVHKLFAGKSCVAGATITLDFIEYHRNEKLKRVHSAGGVKVARGFDIEKPPFVRDSKNTDDLIALRRVGASVLVVAQPHDQLVRTAEQKNSVSRKKEVVRFVVPPGTTANRFSSSLQLPTSGVARIAPEFVNIRHRLVQASTRADVTIDDMQLLPEEKFNGVLKAGRYEAVHFIDDTCDGVVVAVVRGLSGRRQNFPAYSLVAAPDFFPLADQLEVANWVRRDLKNRQEQFAQGAPWPLCEGRRPANLELPRPGAPSRKAFDRNDETVVAVVGPRPLATRTHAPDRKKRFASFLPDAASNEFEPGWDVSLVRDDVGLYYAAYGLGSPFPEDAKLCAALNSFWPAVAPDASRTFHMGLKSTFASPTAIPLMDNELGYHPDHPLVQAGKAQSKPGWDGEYGPFFERLRGKEYVNSASLDRSDYVSNSLRNAFDIRLISWIDATELIRRMQALRACIAALPPANDRVSDTDLWLVTAETIADWAMEASRANAALVGPGFNYVFVSTSGSEELADDVRRRRTRVAKNFDCEISDSMLFWREDQGAWRRA